MISWTKLFHDTIGRVITFVREIWFGQQLRKCKDGTYEVSPKPPYISQLANAKKNKIKGFYKSIHDNNAAKLFGASNLEDFSFWAWRSCGIAGVQMVLKAQLGKKFNETTMDLVNDGLSFDGYNIKTDTGWYHSALCKISQKYGVDSRTAKFISSSQIAKLVLDNKYVLVSLRNKRDGHLILIYGVNIENGKLDSFIVNDPNNFKENGESKEISKDTFNDLSTRRVIIFENKRTRNAKISR